MSESQFEKLLRTLGKTREDNERLRELLRECRRHVGSEMVSVTEVSLRDRIAEELGDE